MEAAAKLEALGYKLEVEQGYDWEQDCPRFQLTATKKYRALVSVGNEISNTPAAKAAAINLGIKGLVTKIENSP